MLMTEEICGGSGSVKKIRISTEAYQNARSALVFLGLVVSKPVNVTLNL